MVAGGAGRKDPTRMISVFARPSRHYSDSPQFDTLDRRPTTNDRATPKQRDPKRDLTMEDTNSKKFIRFQGIYCAFPEIVDRSTQEAIPSKTGYVDRQRGGEGMTTHNGIRYIARTNIVIHPFVLWSLSFYIYRWLVPFLDGQDDNSRPWYLGN